MFAEVTPVRGLAAIPPVMRLDEGWIAPLSVLKRFGRIEFGAQLALGGCRRSQACRSSVFVMSDLWFTVGVPATVAVVTGVYTTGGRAALARRAIRQELEIAAMLPVGQGQAGVERMAEEKAVLYAARWIGPQPLSLRQHTLLVGAAIAGGLMTWSAASLLEESDGNAWWSTYLLLWWFAGLALSALGLTWWISLIVMADNAKTRASTVRLRRERIVRHLRHIDGSQSISPANGDGT